MSLARAAACRVFVCDDQPQLRAALTAVIATLPGFRQVGEAADGPSCVAGLKAAPSDVLILDVHLPGGGPQLATVAREVDPRLHIVVFTAHDDVRLEAAMRRAGADDYVVKTGRIKPLRDALHRGAALMDAGHG